MEFINQLVSLPHLLEEYVVFIYYIRYPYLKPSLLRSWNIDGALSDETYGIYMGKYWKLASDAKTKLHKTVEVHTDVFWHLHTFNDVDTSEPGVRLIKTSVIVL